jgi:hypothetical protein
MNSLASRYQPRLLSTLRMTHHKYAPNSIHSEGQKPLFFMMIWVLYGYSEFVDQRFLSMSKAHTVFQVINSGFF